MNESTRLIQENGMLARFFRQGLLVIAVVTMTLVSGGCSRNNLPPLPDAGTGPKGISREEAKLRIDRVKAMPNMTPAQKEAAINLINSQVRKE